MRDIALAEKHPDHRLELLLYWARRQPAFIAQMEPAIESTIKENAFEDRRVSAWAMLSCIAQRTGDQNAAMRFADAACEEFFGCMSLRRPQKHPQFQQGQGVDMLLNALLHTQRYEEALSVARAVAEAGFGVPNFTAPVKFFADKSDWERARRYIELIPGPLEATTAALVLALKMVDAEVDNREILAVARAEARKISSSPIRDQLLALIKEISPPSWIDKLSAIFKPTDKPAPVESGISKKSSVPQEDPFDPSKIEESFRENLKKQAELCREISYDSLMALWKLREGIVSDIFKLISHGEIETASRLAILGTVGIDRAKAFVKIAQHERTAGRSTHRALYLALEAGSAPIDAAVSTKKNPGHEESILAGYLGVELAYAEDYQSLKNLLEKTRGLSRAWKAVERMLIDFPDTFFTDVRSERATK